MTRTRSDDSKREPKDPGRWKHLTELTDEEKWIVLQAWKEGMISDRTMADRIGLDPSVIEVAPRSESEYDARDDAELYDSKDHDSKEHDAEEKPREERR